MGEEPLSFYLSQQQKKGGRGGRLTPLQIQMERTGKRREKSKKEGREKKIHIIPILCS